MRSFAVAVAALAATVVATGDEQITSTAYQTEIVTITDCEPTVTDCPAESTHVTSELVPITTSTVYTSIIHTITDCGPEVPDCPEHSTIYSTETVPVSTTICPIPTGEEPEHPAPTEDMPEIPEEPEVPEEPEHPAPTEDMPEIPAEPTPEPPKPSVCVPEHSTTEVTKSYTTVITEVEISTIEIPCPTGGEEQPPAPTEDMPEIPEEPPVELPTPTAVIPPPVGGNDTVPPPVPTAGAATLGGSAVFAAVAGLAAFAFA